MVDTAMSLNGERITQRRGFPDAARRAREARGLSQADVGKHLRDTFGEGGQSTVSDWEKGTKTPEPQEVFELERLYRVKAGSLSAHLGYVPVETLTYTEMEQAILADQNLGEADKLFLLRSYRAALQSPL